MTSILDIVLFNADNVSIDPFVLCNTACVNKEALALSNRAWHFVSISTHFVRPRHKAYDKDEGLCRFCKTGKIALGMFACCYNCSKSEMTLITATQAKKTLRLDDDDLNALNHHKSFHKLHRCIMTLVDKHEATMYALIKHKGPENVKKKPSKALLDRRQKLVSEFGLTDEQLKAQGIDRYLACVCQYLRNGKGGIRSVRMALDAWDAFEMRCTNKCKYRDIPGSEMLNTRTKTTSGFWTVDEAIQHLDDMVARRDVLVGELKKHGLILRSDSEMCRKFIAGSRDALDLDALVLLMRQMDFLHRQTRYPGMVYDETLAIKQRIRDFYGWLPKYEYDQVFKEEHADVIERAKRMAVLDFRKRHGYLPDFMAQFMAL